MWNDGFKQTLGICDYFFRSTSALQHIFKQSLTTLEFNELFENVYVIGTSEIVRPFR